MTEFELVKDLTLRIDDVLALTGAPDEDADLAYELLAQGNAAVKKLLQDKWLQERGTEP